MSAPPSFPPSMDQESDSYIRWFCVRTKPKSEHIALAHLRLLDGVESFCPRIRHHKATKRGKVLFTEALFPGYVFSRFDLKTMKNAVGYSHGCVGVVKFGRDFPEIPDSHIDLLKREVGPQDIKVVEQKFKKGDVVELTEGAFQGLQVIVQYYLPAKERLKVLMEILGNEQVVEVPLDHVARPVRTAV